MAMNTTSTENRTDTRRTCQVEPHGGEGVSDSPSSSSMIVIRERGGLRIDGTRPKRGFRLAWCQFRFRVQLDSTKTETQGAALKGLKSADRRPADCVSPKTTSKTTSSISQSYLMLPLVSFRDRAKSPIRNSLKIRNLQWFLEVSNWVQGLDLNQRPSGYEPDRFSL